MKSKPPFAPKILVPILMRDNQPIGCMPDQSSADLIAGIMNRTNPGVTIELGELEKAELELKKRRMK